MQTIGNSILRYIFRDRSSDRTNRHAPDNSRGLTASSGNGSNGNSARPVPASDNVTEFLKEAIVERVVSETLSNNGALDTYSESASRNGHADELFDRPDLGDDAVREMPAWKRVVDVSLILLSMPLWLPITLLVMFWIKMASRGPTFYRQERVGFRRDRFMIFKFRTMHANAETRTHEEYFAHLMKVDCPMTKLDSEGDSRLIAGGRFLRASGLDELPQIFNVLRGEMSLVGPRPCLPNEFQRYETWQRARVNVHPGLTGYWQVNGKNKTTFSEMIAMDIFYARNRSLWNDLMIMWKTVPALTRQTLESRAQRRARKFATTGRSVAGQKLNGAVKKI